jgi:hypothetical protein
MKRNAPALLALQTASSRVRFASIASAKKDLVLALVECAKNIILGNVRLTERQIAALRRHRKDIEELVKTKTGLVKRKTLLQKGGFLGMLIKPIVGLLGNLLGGGLFGGGRRR